MTAQATTEAEEILLRWAESGELEGWIPDSDGDYHHPCFDMLRELKGVMEMASLPGYQAVPIIQGILEAHGLDLTALGYEDAETAVDDLEMLWDKVKLALNEAPLGAAARMANAHPLQFKTVHLGKRYQAFLNIAYQLQQMRGDDYICLPVRPLAYMLGVTPMRISDYRNYAKAEGWLEEIAKAHREGGLATKFMFKVGRNGQ